MSLLARQNFGFKLRRNWQQTTRFQQTHQRKSNVSTRYITLFQTISQPCNRLSSERCWNCLISTLFAQRASPTKTSKQLRNIPFAQLTNIFNSKSISTNEFKSEFIVVMVRQERKDYNNYLLFIYFSTYSIEMIIPMFFRVICLLLLNVLLACFQQSNSIKFLMRTKAILRCYRAFQGQSTNKWFSTVNKRIKVTNQ